MYYSSQKKGKIRRNSVGISVDGDHLSPGSVLEASFSNDSCFSSSLDESSGKKVKFLTTQNEGFLSIFY